MRGKSFATVFGASEKLSILRFQISALTLLSNGRFWQEGGSLFDVSFLVSGAPNRELP